MKYVNLTEKLGLLAQTEEAVLYPTVILAVE